MKNIFSFLILILFISCENKQETTNTQPTTEVPKTETPEIVTIEDRIFNEILALDEIKAYNKYLDSLKGKEAKTTFIISEKPTKESPYYVVKYGFTDEDHFVSEFLFYVYPEPFEIKYFDVVDDTAISIEEWRKRGY